jgi:hypothetical protein
MGAHGATQNSSRITQALRPHPVSCLRSARRGAKLHLFSVYYFHYESTKNTLCAHTNQIDVPIPQHERIEWRYRSNDLDSGETQEPPRKTPEFFALWRLWMYLEKDDYRI